jgi:pyruvate carboxylase
MLLWRRNPAGLGGAARRAFSSSTGGPLATPPPSRPGWRPVRKLMAANRGEIAIRIFRAATEMNIKTVAIYSKEDFGSLHRYKADESFLVGQGKSPIGAYLSAEEIVEKAVEHNVDAIHPGYGFLSENTRFVELCEQAGIAFVGPPSKVIQRFGDKTEARTLAREFDVPIVPGTEQAVTTIQGCEEFTAEYGYPIIIKAAFGGGGRGMRVVREPSELKQSFESASNEALTAFGDGSVFIERYVDSPRHVEVQILADGTDTVHLFERDCSVQRRHQKVVECAPAIGLPDDVTQALWADAVRITRGAGYINAGTVEFLVDPKTWNHYFIEVNPRIQVEHTVTEVITGVDLVQSQIRVAAGQKLADIGLTQDKVSKRGYAIQARVTTEDPALDFRPDTGRLQVWRPAEGFGIRLDGGNAYPGATISPHYDSMLMKVTGSSLTFQSAADKVARALAETRIRGLKTNMPFILNVLRHPDFLSGEATTSFIADSPELFHFSETQNRGQKLLNYLGDLVVNGRSMAGATGGVTPRVAPLVPPPPKLWSPPPKGLKQVLEQGGPSAFAKAVRAKRGLLITDTTWRDAHQSLLATRVRTNDIMAVAPATARALHNCYSIENWGGATFDVCLRFLRECPWERLQMMREAVPNIPFQMLLRGANGVGYTNYPDNAVFKFCDVAVKNGMDVFRVFDSLNYIDNLKLGVDAVGAAGGVVEAAISYTGDISDPKKGKFTLDYYMELARELVACDIHVLAIKDMAGLLKPAAATQLIGALRKEFPNLPLHVHTHDTAGTGVASMLACAEAGADAVDAAVDSMSGMTSQPALGAIACALQNDALSTGITMDQLTPLIEYWESVRFSYSAFESGQKSGSSEVYTHEMPGGQYTNLQFQSTSLGLADQWSSVKKAYAAANNLLGDIVKVTPSSKVVGDLAQFMVTNGLDEAAVREQADTLSFPSSVVEYFQGAIGIPHGGFPQPLQQQVVKDLPVFAGRPGAELEALDLDTSLADLRAKYGEDISTEDLMSWVMYPKVFEQYKSDIDAWGDVSKLPTRAYIEPMELGEEISVELEKGKTLGIKLNAVGTLDVKSGMREVFFDFNGMPRSVMIADRKAQDSKVVRAKATDAPGSVGAPMPGVVLETKVAAGDSIDAGTPMVVLSAMKMETVVAAPLAGKVTEMTVKAGDDVQAGDLLVNID